MDELEYKTNVPVLVLNSAVGKVTEKERRVLKITKVIFFLIVIRTVKNSKHFA